MKEKKRTVIKFTGVNEIQIVEEDIPQTGPHQVLIKTKRTAISAGTELAFLKGEPIYDLSFPCSPGYSNAGEVVGLGDGVQDFELGDRVVSLSPHLSHVIVDAKPHMCLKIPENVTYEQAALSVLGRVAMHGFNLSQLRLRKSALILGMGIIGQYLAQLSMLGGGCPVIGVDNYEKRLEVASACGLKYTVNTARDNLAKEVEVLTDGKGVNVIMEATGNPKAVPLALKVSGQKGRIVIISSIRQPAQIDLYTHFQMKELTLIGCHQPKCPTVESAYYLRTQQWNHRTILDLVSQGKIKVDPLITHRFSYEKAIGAYHMLVEKKENTLGVILEW